MESLVDDGGEVGEVSGDGPKPHDGDAERGRSFGHDGCQLTKQMINEMNVLEFRNRGRDDNTGVMQGSGNTDIVVDSQRQ